MTVHVSHPLFKRLRKRLHDYPDTVTLNRRLETLLHLPEAVADTLIEDTSLAQKIEAAVIAGDAPVVIAVRLAEHLVRLLDKPVSHDLDDVTLAQAREREWLSIAVREQTGEFTIEESAHAYSKLADQLSLRTLQAINPATPRLILYALGKWGGLELNACSDIDPVFLSPDDLSPEAADRLVRQWNKTMSGSREHPLYEVDLRLRPEGDTGPLACSFNAAEKYFLQRAAFWERIAWLRARPINGDEPGWIRDLLNHFLFAMGGDVGEKMSRIANALRGIHQTARPRDLKRAPGGIRDIEFLVAAMQLVEGQREKKLRSGSVSHLIRTLSKLRIVNKSDAESLLRAYHFFRRLEHILQVEEGKARFIVPEPGDLAHARIAFTLDLKPKLFEEQWRAHRATVTRLVSDQLMDPSETSKTIVTTIDPQLDPKSFVDDQHMFDSRAQAILNRLSGKWGSATRLFDSDQLFPSASASDGLARLEAAVSAYGGPEAWALAFAERQEVKSEITRMLLHGRRIVEEANLQPHLWERIGRKINPLPNTDPAEELSTKLSGQTFHLGESFLAGAIDAEALTEAWTQAIDSIASILAVDVLPANNQQPAIALLASGKWGGHELAPDGDLDLLFVCDEADSAQLSNAVSTVTLFLTTLSLNGRLTPDARLRPEGSGAPLCVTISRMETYLNTRAASWEKLALVRTRFIAGDPDVGMKAQDLLRRFAATPPDPSDMPTIHQARKKASQLVRAKPGTLRIKKARGGMMDFEFAVTFASWRLGFAPDNSWASSLFERMRTLAYEDAKHADLWKDALDAYIELRRWELVQTFSSSHRRGDVPIQGEEGERFAEAASLSLDDIRKRWQETSKLGRELFEVMAETLV